MKNPIHCVSKWIRSKMYGPRVPDPAVGPSEKLATTARDLKWTLQPYLEAPDPLVALMTDIFNKRQLSRLQENGKGLQ